MARRSISGKVVSDLTGWILISTDETDETDVGDEWHIAWVEPFSSKKSAMQFATRNCWPKPWQAVRGRIMVDPA
jgi:hypothetical protein